MTTIPKTIQADVLIIGAGPSGSVAASLLRQKGYTVAVFERETFPRFSIGESLLPQSMEFLEKIGALSKIQDAGFQYKNGAYFQWGQRHSIIDFGNNFTPGWTHTFQVQRARFDTILADHASELGADIYYNHTISSYEETVDGVRLIGKDDKGNLYQAEGRFVLDASGYGRVLSRLLDIEKPSNFPVRKAIFCHVKDNITHPSFDRDKILVTIHPQFPDIWYWLIPFQDGTSSVGVVGCESEIDTFGSDDESRIRALFQDDENLRTIMPSYEFIRDIGSKIGYSCSVKTLYGNKFALLGNAGEFLDPVFSSGLTIALKSADLATDLLSRQLRGEIVNWETDYSDALMVGVKAFRVFVEGWYEGSLQTVIFNQPTDNNSIKKMIISMLAGYAWDQNNAFVRDGKRLLPLVAERCTE